MRKKTGTKKERRGKEVFSGCRVRVRQGSRAGKGEHQKKTIKRIQFKTCTKNGGFTKEKSRSGGWRGKMRKSETQKGQKVQCYIP